MFKSFKKIKLTVAILKGITSLSSYSSDDKITICDNRITSLQSSSTNGISTFIIDHRTENSDEMNETEDEATYNYYKALFDDNDFTND
jgi:hypothetical protein